MNLGIVGYGKVGGSFKKAFPSAKVLSRKGVEFSYDNVEQFLYGLDTVLICVKDDVISDVSKLLSNYDVSGKCFMHTSGALTSDELASLKFKGAFTGSIHPIQTFPVQDGNLLKDIYFSFEGDDLCYEKAIHLAQNLNSKVIRIDKKLKPLYHTACVFVSNFTNLCYMIAEEISGISFEVFYPLAETTLKNALKMKPSNSLTGPALRRDMKTIELHLKSLKDEEVKRIYRVLTDYILKINTLNQH